MFRRRVVFLSGIWGRVARLTANAAVVSTVPWTAPQSVIAHLHPFLNSAPRPTHF